MFKSVRHRLRPSLGDEKRAGGALEDLRHGSGGGPQLRFWLFAQNVNHVAMESAGVYGKLVWSVFTGLCKLLLANLFTMHNISGRKTDASDAEWVADLLALGLLKPRFLPPVAFQDLRDGKRLRVMQVEERHRIQNRIEKLP